MTEIYIPISEKNLPKRIKKVWCDICKMAYTSPGIITHRKTLKHRINGRKVQQDTNNNNDLIMTFN